MTRAALLLAGAGAVAVTIGPDGPLGLGGLVAIALGTVLAAPAARGPGGAWWSLMASGAVLSAIGAIVAIPTEAVGGLLALLGGAAVLVGATLGFPARRPPASS